MKRIFSTAIGVAILISSMLTRAACGDGGKKDIDLTGRTELVIDGGGQNANFNSSSSMIYDPYANPYPYNTLETLADEWNAEHPESAYYFTVAESSINNDRETMVPALNQGTAPEILYYLSTGSEDLTKNWFVDLTEHFGQRQVEGYLFPGRIQHYICLQRKEVYGGDRTEPYRYPL